MSIPHVPKASLIALPMVFGWLLSCLSGSRSNAFANFRASDNAQPLDAYDKMPLGFESNQGQTDRRVKFLSRGLGYALFLTPTEAVISLKAGNGQHADKGSVLPGNIQVTAGFS